MKRVLLSLSLIAFGNVLFAASCENLGITIINGSDDACVLKNNRMDFGVAYDTVPSVIPAHSKTPIFYMLQGNNGIKSLLDYRCGANKVALFYSIQEYCGFSAGAVYGSPLMVSDMNLDYQATVGSYWSAIPGQITWRIY